MHESVPLVRGLPKVRCAADVVTKTNHRLKQRDSLPLNTAREAVGSEVPQCGPRAKLRHGVEAEAFSTFSHNILHFCPMQDFWPLMGRDPTGAIVNTLALSSLANQVIRWPLEDNCNSLLLCNRTFLFFSPYFLFFI